MLDVPAFPVPNDDDHFYGMTLRDYFAAKIAQGDAAAGEGWPTSTQQDVIEKRARCYYRFADAMLKVRGEV